MRTTEKDAWLHAALGLTLPDQDPAGGMAAGGSADDDGAEGAHATGDPDAADTATTAQDYTDPGPAIGPPSPPQATADGRSRDDVLRIMHQSRSLQDLALDLGLGPASMETLARYLAAHGVTVDDLKAATAQPDAGNRFYKLGYAQGQQGGLPACPKDAGPADEKQYDLGFAAGKKHPAGALPDPPAPTAGPVPPGQEIISREISILDADSDPPRVRMAMVTGTKAQIDEVEAQAQDEIVHGMASGLLQGLAGVRAGQEKFGAAVAGTPTSSAGARLAMNGAEIHIME